MIKNATKKRIIVKKFEIAKTPWKKTKGLMFRKELAKGSGLLMIFERERKHGIWMLGMRFPIDIVFIDSRKRIVDIRHSVKPVGRHPKTWRVYKPSKPSKYVLEVNSRLVKRSGTDIGDFLEF